MLRFVNFRELVRRNVGWMSESVIRYLRRKMLDLQINGGRRYRFSALRANSAYKQRFITVDLVCLSRKAQVLNLSLIHKSV